MGSPSHLECSSKRQTPEYRAWAHMKTRCFNSKVPEYKHYGGRGISVCAAWMKFEQFIADMGRRPSSCYSLDRIDVNGNYEPGNCRWATHEEQANNRRDTVFVTLNGQRATLTEWARIVGVPRDTIDRRLRVGDSPEVALLTIRPKLKVRPVFAKLNQQIADDIRSQLGVASRKHLAATYGVTADTIGLIARNRIWRSGLYQTRGA